MDFDITKLIARGADVDNADLVDETHSINSYDLNGIKKYEKRYETLYFTHSTLLVAERKLLELAKSIQSEIRKDLGNVTP